MKIEQGSYVEFHYALVDSDEVQEGTFGDDPLSYIHGQNMLVPGLEEALEGRAEGDRFRVEVPPNKGYGERDETLIEVVPREAFDNMPGLKKGLLVQIDNQTSDGSLARIVDIDNREVTLDTNHPHAGETLNFEIQVVNVRAARQEEMDKAQSLKS